ncbi:MAG: prepilin peptidase [Telmatospirillum sp.]|nr:prepilin peptidase [Telmatospirillum sp.]
MTLGVACALSLVLGIGAVAAAGWCEPRIRLLLDYRPIRAMCLRPMASARPSSGRDRLCAVTGVAIIVAASACQSPDCDRVVAAGVLCAGLLLCSRIDGRHRVLPDLILGPMMAAGLGFDLLTAPFVGIRLGMAGAGTGLAAGLLVRSLGRRMGLGDVKLLAVLGMWLGPAGVIATFWLASALALAAMLMTPKSRRTRPFGPFLAAATAGILIIASHVGMPDLGAGVFPISDWRVDRSSVDVRERESRPASRESASTVSVSCDIYVMF